MDNKQRSAPKKGSDGDKGRDGQQRWLRLALGYVLPGLFLAWMFQDLVTPAALEGLAERLLKQETLDGGAVREALVDHPEARAEGELGLVGEANKVKTLLRPDVA